jgi:hypothetical protein
VTMGEMGTTPKKTEPFKLAAGFPFLVLWQPVYSPGQWSPVAIVDAISSVVRAGPDVVEAAAVKLLEAP